MSIRVPSEWDGKRPSNVGRSRKFRYGRTPEEVLIDSALSDKAARLYGIMAMYVYEDNIVTLGVRKLAELLSVGKSTAQRTVNELISLGYMRASKGRNGQRSFYVLTSPVFSQKQGKRTIVKSGPSGQPRMVSVAAEDVA